MTPPQRPEPRLTRRRMLAAVAVVAGVPFMAVAPGRDNEAPPRLRWRGTALGAPAQITLCHPDPARARKVLGACLAEVARLERAFSLYRSDSEIVALNRSGVLAASSRDFVALLSDARRFGELSDGAFDVTVQPLWHLYTRHFAQANPLPRGPDPRAVAAALALVDYRNLEIGRARVRLARPGMALTLNGIAQGAITDRVADLLRDAGFDQVLVELGEIRALGGDGAGAPWRIGVADARAPSHVDAVMPLADAALATSAGYGTQFDASGRFHHLFDPASGGSAAAVLSASAIAPSATVADALATALAVAPPDRATRLLRRFGGSTARLVLADGRTVTHAA